MGGIPPRYLSDVDARPHRAQEKAKQTSMRCKSSASLHKVIDKTTRKASQRLPVIYVSSDSEDDSSPLDREAWRSEAHKVRAVIRRARKVRSREQRPEVQRPGTSRELRRDLYSPSTDDDLTSNSPNASLNESVAHDDNNQSPPATKEPKKSLTHSNSKQHPQAKFTVKLKEEFRKLPEGSRGIIGNFSVPISEIPSNEVRRATNMMLHGSARDLLNLVCEERQPNPGEGSGRNCEIVFQGMRDAYDALDTKAYKNIVSDCIRAVDEDGNPGDIAKDVKAKIAKITEMGTSTRIEMKLQAIEALLNIFEYVFFPSTDCKYGKRGLDFLESIDPMASIDAVHSSVLDIATEIAQATTRIEGAMSMDELARVDSDHPRVVSCRKKLGGLRAKLFARLDAAILSCKALW